MGRKKSIFKNMVKEAIKDWRVDNFIRVGQMNETTDIILFGLLK